MRRHASALLGAVATGALCAITGMAVAADTGPAAAPPTTAPPAAGAQAAPSAAPIDLVKDPRALAALKAMSERLASAKSFTVHARNIVPMVGPNGQWISLIGSARVALQRPDRLFVERGGDQVRMDVYYDGKTLTLYAPDEKLYAEVPAPPTLDATLTEALDSAESTFPYLEVLLSDPYGVITTDLKGALYVGESSIEGVKTEHLALVSPGVDWEIWIGADDKLPRLVQAKYVQVEKVPTIMTHFYDWKLDAPIPAATFVFEKAAGAHRIEHIRPSATAPVKPASSR